MKQAGVVGEASSSPGLVARRHGWPGSVGSPAWPRHAAFALFIVGVLAYGAALAWYTLDRFDLLNLIRDGYRDDAFYYFQIAYHMAEGRFSTFDGGITRTNGYHPLGLFLITPFYWRSTRPRRCFAIWDCLADANEVAEWTFGGKVAAITDWTQTVDGLCASAAVLPHGHVDPVRVRRAPLAVAGLAGGRPPAIREDTTATGGFDVYLAEDVLVYVKTACERVNFETPFFLHVVPAGDDFDDGREAHGFNNLDFTLAWHGDWLGEEGEIAPCLAEVPLPKYGIAKITTGQYMQDLRIGWGGEIRPPTTEGA